MEACSLRFATAGLPDCGPSAAKRDSTIAETIGRRQLHMLPRKRRSTPNLRPSESLSPRCGGERRTAEVMAQSGVQEEAPLG